MLFPIVPVANFISLNPIFYDWPYTDIYHPPPKKNKKKLPFSYCIKFNRKWILKIS